MRLIAKKPCNFGGKQFFIGDEIPENIVADAKMQEKLGVIVITTDGGASVEQAGVLFSQEQVDEMVVDAVAEAEQRYADKMAKLNEKVSNAYSGTVIITVKGDSNEQDMDITVTSEEIQQVFKIQQLTAEEGARVIADVTNENVLILLHAADSRKTIKEAAKKQADNLFSMKENSNGASNGKQSTGIKTEGSDT